MNIKQLLASEFVNKYKSVILPASSVIVCIGLLIFVIIPQISSSFETIKSLGSSEESFKNLSKKVNLLEQINSSEYRQNVSTALIALPSEKDVPGALNQILFLLNANKLKLNSIGLGGGSPSSNNIEGIQFRLEVEGDISGLKSLLTRVKSVPRLMKVTDLEVSGNRGDIIQATISLTTYFQQITTNLGEIDRPIEEVTQKDLEVLAGISNSQRSIPTTSAVNISGPTGKSDSFE
jgi:Tfp pilus assembly protein PilO